MLLASVFVIVMTAALLVPLPSGGREMQALQDLLHAPAFALAAFLINRAYAAKSTRGRMFFSVFAWAVLVGLGCLTELVQGAVGRSTSSWDALSNAIGALAGTTLALAMSPMSRLRRAGAFLICSTLLVCASTKPLIVLTDAWLQRREMPLLGSFEHTMELTRWTAQNCGMERVRHHATHGKWALLIDMQPGLYPGVAMRWPASDWSSYDMLVFDLSVDDEPPLDIVIKIEDAEHNGDHEDRYNRSVRLSRGTHRFQISLEKVRTAPQSRRMNLRQVAFLQFFTVDLASQRKVYLDNVHLARNQDGRVR